LSDLLGLEVATVDGMDRHHHKHIETAAAISMASATRSGYLIPAIADVIHTVTKKRQILITPLKLAGYLMPVLILIY
jgi:hypothetical protein